MATHTLFLPGEFHGQRSLVGYSPQAHKELEWQRLTTHRNPLAKNSPQYTYFTFLVLELWVSCLYIMEPAQFSAFLISAEGNSNTFWWIMQNTLQSLFTLLFLIHPHPNCQEILWALLSKSKMQYLDAISKMTGWSLFISKANHGISQWKWQWNSLTCLQLFATQWTIQPMKFSRPQYWNGTLSFLPGIFPTISQ